MVTYSLVVVQLYSPQPPLDIVEVFLHSVPRDKVVCTSLVLIEQKFQQNLHVKLVSKFEQSMNFCEGYYFNQVGNEIDALQASKRREIVMSKEAIPKVVNSLRLNQAFAYYGLFLIFVVMLRNCQFLLELLVCQVVIYIKILKF